MMRRSAALVATWREQKRRAVVARPVETQGLGPRGDDDVLLVDDAGRAAGSLLGGTAHAETVLAARALLDDPAGSYRLLGIDIDFDDATAAGLTCGGHVDVLVQRLDDIPDELWHAIATGRPAALVSRIGDGHGTLVVRPGSTSVGTLGSSGLDTLAQAEAEPLLTHPGTTSARVRVGEVDLIVEGWNPVPHLVIVGAATLAEALTRQAGLLGWQATTTTEVDDTLAAVDQLTTADMVVVLEHRPSIAAPALAAALRGRVGYVGALGSRRTQDVRRRALEDEGLTYVELDRLHGPTGLDLGARTPAETAVSIVAEILAVRSGRAATSLRASRGRIGP
jgi:xanthine dehydrogenase accessory factor